MRLLLCVSFVFLEVINWAHSFLQAAEFALCYSMFLRNYAEFDKWTMIRLEPDLFMLLIVASCLSCPKQLQIFRQYENFKCSDWVAFFSRPQKVVLVWWRLTSLLFLEKLAALTNGLLFPTVASVDIERSLSELGSVTVTRLHYIPVCHPTV